MSRDFLDELDLGLRHARAITRRQFLGQSGGLGALAVAMLGGRGALGAGRGAPGEDNPNTPKPPHFPAKAKRVIYLHMSGGPPQQELFDDKPLLVKHNMQPCPD